MIFPSIILRPPYWPTLGLVSTWRSLCKFPSETFLFTDLCLDETFMRQSFIKSQILDLIYRMVMTFFYGMTGRTTKKYISTSPAYLPLTMVIAQRRN